MFGLFGKFGRARELRELDRALREVDLHPALVPEAVELTLVRLLKRDSGREPALAYGDAAALVGYCMLGAEAFAAANGALLTGSVEERLETALRSGDSLDARVVLLLLHAGLIQPSVVAEYALEVDPE